MPLVLQAVLGNHSDLRYSSRRTPMYTRPRLCAICDTAHTSITMYTRPRLCAPVAVEQRCRKVLEVNFQLRIRLGGGIGDGFGHGVQCRATR